MLLVKKYPNRRLYDTRSSRYITLDDLEKTIRGGEDVTVQDATDGRDLTQETLTQIILDRGGGRILPSALLMRLIRLDDAALGEFLTRYVSWALDMYMGAKDRARALLPLNPLATAPFAATDALARLVLGATQWGSKGEPPAPPPEPPFIVERPRDPAGGPETLPPEPPLPEPAHVAPQESPLAAASALSDEMQRLRREIDALKATMVAPQRERPAKKKSAKKAASKRA